MAQKEICKASHLLRFKFGSSFITESQTVKNLGLTIDRCLSFDDHITHLVAKSTGILISLAHSRHVLPSWTVAYVVNALVVSSIRYCVSVYGSCNDSQLHRVQKLLNFCARVIGGRRKYDRVSDVLRQLGWLSARQLVSYHRLCLIKTALDTQLPADIAAMFSYVSTPHHTRQSGQLQCPRAKNALGPGVYLMPVRYLTDCPMTKVAKLARWLPTSFREPLLAT